MRRSLLLVIFLVVIGATVAIPARDNIFAADQWVRVTAPLETVRVEPAPLAERIAVVYEGEEFLILSGAPVRTDDAAWWNVLIVGDEHTSGWVPERSIGPLFSTPVPAPTPTPIIEMGSGEYTASDRGRSRSNRIHE